MEGILSKSTACGTIHFLDSWSLVLTCFPQLSQSQNILPVCPPFITYLIFIWYILYHFWSSNRVMVPPLSRRRDGMGVGASIEALQTQCL